MNLEDARCFVSAVEQGTITAAAEEIGVSRPTLSRRLADFEEQLGLALLHRTTRRVRPTAAGRRLYESLRPVLDEAARVAASVVREREVVSGCLRVSVPPALAGDATHVLVALHRAHPGLRVDLRSTPSRVDLRTDAVDVVLRVGRLHDPDLVHRVLTRRPIGAWSSPAYLEERGIPTDPQCLVHHTLLRSLDVLGEPRKHWPVFGGPPVSVQGTFVSDDQFALAEAAASGVGIALLGHQTAGAASRPLVPVLKGVIGIDLPVHAVVSRRTLQPARVRAFLDTAATWFATHPRGHRG